MNTDFVIDFKLADRYRSPANEGSVYKGIPIEHRHHPVIEKFLKSGLYRVKYRGPRYDWTRSTCLKSNAKSFAIYPR